MNVIWLVATHDSNDQIFNSSYESYHLMTFVREYLS